MRGFHIILNYLALLGKMYEDSGLEDLLIESGVYGSNSASCLLKGKSYNRGVRCHKLVMEAMFRLQWCSFIKDLTEEDAYTEDDTTLASIASYVDACSQKQDVPQAASDVSDNMQPILTLFEQYKETERNKSLMFTFWDQYITMILIMLQFIKADRMGDWQLHLSTTVEMVPYVHAMDRTNYAR
jgi:hypothetical protein